MYLIAISKTIYLHLNTAIRSNDIPIKRISLISKSMSCVGKLSCEISNLVGLSDSVGRVVLRNSKKDCRTIFYNKTINLSICKSKDVSGIKS